MTRPLIAARDIYHLEVIVLLTVVGALPSARLRGWITRRLGATAYRTSRAKRRAAEASVRLTCGTDADVQSIVRSSFVEFWREMLEFTSPARLDQMQVCGLEHVRGALARGHGAILWESNGFGYRTASKKLLHSIGLPVHQVHGRNNVGNFHVPPGSSTWLRERLVTPFFDRHEERWVADIVYLPATDSFAFTRRLQQILARNGILCIAGDGQDGRRFVPVDFLGGTARLATGMVTLSQVSGAPLLPLICTLDPAGGIVLTVGAPIRLDPSAERDEALHAGLQQYATQLQAHVGRQPGLYRNWHLLDALRERQAAGVA